MSTIIINDHRYEFCYPSVVIKSDKIMIYVKKWKQKKKPDGHIKKFWVTGIYTAPSTRTVNVNIGGITYKCRNMKPEKLSILKNHLETLLALDNL